MFKLMGKEINGVLGAQTILLSGPMVDMYQNIMRWLLRFILGIKAER